MYKKINSNPDIYVIYIPLPNNPLKNLNCYVIKTSGKNLIIDTGFNLKECYEALMEGLKDLEIDMAQTEIFLTHLHADHTGLVSSIINKDTVIYMNRIDHEYIKSMLDNEYWEKRDIGYLMEGFDQEELEAIRIVNPAKIFNTNKMFNVVKIEDNDKINIGEYEFTCIFTPGHTPGHMCLYMEKQKILFSGDHILFDISPNVTRWHWAKNSLRDYLISLDKIKNFKIEITLPAHRNNEMDVYERIEQLKQHHMERLQEMIDVITENPNLHAYDIAGKMKWSMKGKKWNDAPPQQKWFAVGETLSHLDYLVIEKKIYKRLSNDIYYYFVN